MRSITETEIQICGGRVTPRSLVLLYEAEIAERMRLRISLAAILRQLQAANPGLLDDMGYSSFKKAVDRHFRAQANAKRRQRYHERKHASPEKAQKLVTGHVSSISGARRPLGVPNASEEVENSSEDDAFAVPRFKMPSLDDLPSVSELS